MNLSNQNGFSTVLAVVWAALTWLVPARANEPRTGAEPAVSLVLGGAWYSPFGPSTVHGDYGTRIGLGFSSTVEAGELQLPVEWDLSLRTASLGFTGWFNRDVFSDLQIPIILHGALPAWKRLEFLALWTPSYTLDMITTSPDAGQVVATQSLRTRFNMGFGGGLQLLLPWGVRLRGFGAYNIFAPLPASNLTFADWVVEATLPLFWKRVPQ
jgi:hypothetical protein